MDLGWLAAESALPLVATHKTEFELGVEDESGQGKKRKKGNCESLYPLALEKPNHNLRQQKI